VSITSKLPTVLPTAACSGVGCEGANATPKVLVCQKPGKIRENLGKIYKQVFMICVGENIRTKSCPKASGKFGEIPTLKNLPAPTSMAARNLYRIKKDKLIKGS